MRGAVLLRWPVGVQGSPMLNLRDLFVSAVLGLMGVALGGSVVAAEPQEEPSRPPNVLVIVADDQSPLDLRAYRPDSLLETPVIDALSAGGVTIDGAYHMGSWSGAVCSPSRHMIMSGRTLWHLPSNGVAGAGPNPHCPEDLAQNTLAAVFNRAGYETMRTCKRGNSYEGANAQFTVRREASKRGPGPEDGSAWHADQVLDYLGERDAAQSDKPFLIYLGFSHPHDPRNGPEELLEKYGANNESVADPALPKAPPLPDNYLPAHPFHHGHPRLRDEVAVQGVGERRDEATIRNEIGRQFACSENIDIQIGRVLAELEALGELDNTYVLYTADHGMAIGRHGLQGKQNLYEHTWRVPLIVSGPGIPAGTRAAGNVYLTDLLATVCELTGVDPPETSEGLSFAPVLRGERAVVRDVLYGAYCGGTKPGMRSVRRGDWKLVKFDVLEGAVRETQLFNLSSNPSEFLPQHDDPEVILATGIEPGPEQTNLAGDPKFADRLAEMEALLAAEMRRLDDPYQLWDQE